MPLPLTVIKALVDTSLYLVSYLVQKVWVFAPAKKPKEPDPTSQSDPNYSRKEVIHEKPILR